MNCIVNFRLNDQNFSTLWELKKHSIYDNAFIKHFEHSVTQPPHIPVDLYLMIEYCLIGD